MKTPPGHLLVGEIRKPHGIRGEVLVVPTTDNVDAMFQPGAELLLADREGRPFDSGTPLTLERVRPFKNGLILQIEGVDDRDGAEMLRGRTLVIPAEDAPPLEANEFFLHDLMELKVSTVEGESVGRVENVYTIGATHVLSVIDEGHEHLIPFIREVVRKVDLEAGTIVIDPPRGLLDL